METLMEKIAVVKVLSESSRSGGSRKRLKELKHSEKLISKARRRYAHKVAGSARLRKKIVGGIGLTLGAAYIGKKMIRKSYRESNTNNRY